jgi:LuxR family transcriptional activator of conjugal transfer of Ti plasmids
MILIWNLKLVIADQLVNLTQRGLECLRYRQQGQSAKEMARVMGISYHTVESYFENIKIKSGLGNVSQVLAICRDEGLL